MLSKEIEKWFNDDCPYLQGVKLYREVGGIYPIRIFEGYEQATFISLDLSKKLKAALQTYLNIHPAPTAPNVANPVTMTENTTFSPEPSAIQALREKAIPWHKKQALLHARLGVVQTDAERYEIAQLLMEEVIPSLDSIYGQIRHWKQTGEAPKEVTTNRDNYVVQKMLRRSSLKSRISRIRSLLKKDMHDQESAKLSKELLEKEAEVKSIETEFSL